MLVSNTSTLVLLAKVGCLESFIDMAPPIQIPVQVKKEALFEEGSYYARLIEQLILAKKLRVMNVQKNQIAEVMSKFNLDEGEAAAYTLFNAGKHNAVLTDDGELIKLCKLKKIQFICAMAVVIILSEKKKLSKDDALDKLKELNTIGRYSQKLYDYFKSEVA